MKQRTGAAGRHLDTRSALDYLESRMEPARRHQVESHLGSPCPRCHQLIRELGWLVERMRLDRVPDVTPQALSRAIGLFQPPVAPAKSSEVGARLAALVFDSWSQPLAAGAYRSVGEIRRLRFALGADALELESEVESAGTRVLRGRLTATEPTLHRIELEVGHEHLATRPDGSGSFAFGAVPLGPATITVSDGEHRYRLPPLE